jgi:hypothetical protein
MKIELKEVTVRELTAGYKDNEEKGVIGYNALLNIRPPYQREFIYKEAQRDAVIDTIIKGFPLNVMYWAVREDGNYEVIDGQQRTISICKYLNSDFTLNNRYFHNLQQNEKDQILNYKLMIYFCSGLDSEKLDWFKTINIAGEKLTEQELRNAVYTGSWVSDAKKHFSKNGCAAYGIGSNYLVGTPIRQDYLETAIKWVSENNIEHYMAEYQHEPNANELWLYFQSVINWVKAVFINYRKEMKGIEWGFLYNKFKEERLDSKRIELDIIKLMEDEDVTNKKGVYSYILTKQERHLSLRAFSLNQKRELYEKQKGICPICKSAFKLEDMEADHITPWHKGGATISQNCQMLCKDDNRRKSGI